MTRQCLEPGGIIRFLYREAADREEDSGWRMFSGLEEQDYIDDPKNIRIINVGYLLDIDPTLLVALKGKIGDVYERADKAAKWEFVKDWRPDRYY